MTERGDAWRTRLVRCLLLLGFLVDMGLGAYVGLWIHAMEMGRHGTQAHYVVRYAAWSGLWLSIVALACVGVARLVRRRHPSAQSRPPQ